MKVNKMKVLNYLFNLLIVGLILLLIISKSFIDQYRDQCNNLGGIYIEGQCIKAEVINLKEKI